MPLSIGRERHRQPAAVQAVYLQLEMSQTAPPFALLWSGTSEHRAQETTPLAHKQGSAHPVSMWMCAYPVVDIQQPVSYIITCPSSSPFLDSTCEKLVKKQPLGQLCLSNHWWLLSLPVTCFHSDAESGNLASKVWALNLQHRLLNKHIWKSTFPLRLSGSIQSEHLVIGTSTGERNLSSW